MPKGKTIASVLVMGAILVVVGGALVFLKVRQFAAFSHMKWVMPPTAVTSAVVREQAWHPTLSAVGTVEAVNGVTVSTDLPGLVDQILFESGQQVKQGDPLLKLDTRQEDAQLHSGLARLQLAQSNLERLKGLLEKRVSSQSDYDAAVAEFKEAQAAVAETRALVERKLIRAPFTGVLGIRQVNLGQYMKSGDAVVPLQSLDPIYVNFGLPQQQLKELVPGREIRVKADALEGETFSGKITSVNSVIDEATRNVMVQATLGNPGHALRPGMFVNVDVLLPDQQNVLAVPVTAINYAPYGSTVFVIEKMKGADGSAYDGVREQAVVLGPARGDQVVVESGLAPGEEIVTTGGFKLAPKSPVERSNATQPPDSAAPHPSDS